MAEEELGLAEAIDAVRSELRRAQDRGRGAGVRFTVGAVEVEFVVEVTKRAGAEASVKVLNILALGTVQSEVDASISQLRPLAEVPGNGAGSLAPATHG